MASPFLKTKFKTNKKPITSISLVLLLTLPLLLIALGSSTTELSHSPLTHNKSSIVDLGLYDWPQIHGDPSFTRFSSGPAPEAADVLWKTKIPGLQSYTTAFNNKIFVTTRTAVLALDKDTGITVWNTTLPSLGLWAAVYKIDDTRLVVGRYCLETETGKVLWESGDFSARLTYFSPGVYVPEEKMFYIKGQSIIQAWDFSTPSNPPTLFWEVHIPGGGSSGSGIHYGDGKIFPGTFDAYQMAIDAKTGKVLWETQTTGAMAFSGSFYQGKFFRGGPDNQFYAFNATTGEVLWVFNPGTEFGSWNVGSAAAYGKIYQVNTDGHLYALDAETGAIAWQYKGPGHIFIAGHPVVADGKVYATTGQASSHDPHTGEPSKSEFVCLDAYTGDLLWKLPIEAHAPRESVAIAYGNLYIIPGYIQERMDIYETPDEVWAIGSKSWPMWRQNSANTGAGQSGPTDLSVRWKFATGGAVISSPTVVDGRVYVGSNDRNLYCLDALTGNLIWNFTTGAPIKSSPAVADGKVYLGPDDGFVYAIDAQTGNLIWRQNAGGYIEAHLDAVSRLRSSPVIVAGNLYVGSLDTKLYSFDADSGNFVWSFKTEGYITSSPAVADGAVYFTSQEPSSAVLYKLAANDGSLIWKLDIPYVLFAERGRDVHASPVVVEDMVFGYSNKLHYYSVNATTGSINWNYTAVFENFLVGSVAYFEGTIFLIDQFFLVAVEADSGVPIWKSWIGSELYSSPTYADGKVYVTTDRHSIYVLNATTGERLSWFQAGSKFWSSPTLYQGRLYVGNHDWNIYCLVDSAFPVVSVTIDAVLNNDVINKTQNEHLIISGHLTPEIAYVPLRVTLQNPNSEQVSLNAFTNDKGFFSTAYTPDITGEWVVTVHYEGLEYPSRAYSSAKSQDLLLQVVEFQEAALQPAAIETSLVVILAIGIIAVVAGYVYVKKIKR